LYKVYYDKKTGQVLGYYVSGMNYPNGIPKPNIEITDQERNAAYDSAKVAKVIDGKFVLEDKPIIIVTKQEKLNELNLWIESENVRIAGDLTLDLASGLTLEEAQTYAQEETDLVIAEYEKRLAEIQEVQ